VSPFSHFQNKQEHLHIYNVESTGFSSYKMFLKQQTNGETLYSAIYKGL